MKKVMLYLLSLIFVTSLSGIALASNYASYSSKISKQIILSEDDPAPSPTPDPAPAPEPAPTPEPEPK